MEKLKKLNCNTYPFEIHITVKYPDDIDKFKKVCKELKVKPIVLDLIKNNASLMIDVMTSSKFNGTLKTAKEYCSDLVKKLKETGYNVLRKKIETVPWHPEAPSLNNNKTMKNGKYFESHIQVVVTTESVKKLSEITKVLPIHLSRNFFKKLKNDEYIIMLTYRKYDFWYEIFLNDIEFIKLWLESRNFIYEKVEVEYAIYDSKESHDKSWISN